MNELQLINFLFRRWKNSDTNEEKFNVLIDLLSNTEDGLNKYIEYFNVDLDEIEYFDVFDIEDYMEERSVEFEDCWRTIARVYEQE